MKNTLMFSVVTLGIFLTLFNCKSKEVEKLETAQKAAETLQKSLLKDLTESIQAKGTAESIDQCKGSSPEIEKKLKQLGNYNLVVKRVSQKFRNPEHAPDAFESEILAKWDKDKQEGRELKPFGGQTPTGYRFLKPILIQNDLCMKCHGDLNSMEAKTREAIFKNYPADKAHGYKLNDLRGAISITIQ